MKIEKENRRILKKKKNLFIRENKNILHWEDA